MPFTALSDTESMHLDEKNALYNKSAILSAMSVTKGKHCSV